MTKLTGIITLLFLSINLYGQITFRYNHLRTGDEISKQQVEFKEPGRTGANVVWDFGKLQPINEEYIIDYSTPIALGDSLYVMGHDSIPVKGIVPEELIIGTEHNTRYYYRVIDNKLYILGHENPTTLLKYNKPLLSLAYPTTYGNSFTSDYNAKGLYSSRIPFESYGNVNIKADSYGIMVLPGGDTLRHVLRIYSKQSITESIEKASGEKVIIKSDLESYKWYAKGYRYPVFETLRTTNIQDTTQLNKFETAFFFPPQDHFYLDNDPDNLAVLDSLWNIAHKPEDIIKPGDNNQPKQLSYNFYPNPVESYLTIEYYLEEESPVSFVIYTLEGKQIKMENIPAQKQGLYSHQIDFTGFTKGTYILKIQTKYSTITDKIIKK